MSDLPGSAALPRCLPRAARGSGRLTDRREFMRLCTAAAATTALGAASSQPKFETRGVVLMPPDLSLGDWPARAAKAGINTIALHEFTLLAVLKVLDSDTGRHFLAECHRLGLRVEYELHLMTELLERRRFDRDPSLFRMDGTGQRVRDWNLCVSSEPALDTVAENAAAVARILKPTTGRHFFWGDDNKGWCQCPKCKGLSNSEQALVVENRIVKQLRKENPDAMVAHLCYQPTLAAPVQVKPEPGVFLEFAPIERAHPAQEGRPIAPLSQRESQGRPGGYRNGDLLDFLDANLSVFPAATAQALDYWLDDSLFSKWRRPVKKLVWYRDVFLDDLATYAKRGIRHVTSFACYLDADYVQRFGDIQPMLQEYGEGLNVP